MRTRKTTVGAALFAAACSFMVSGVAATAPDFLKDEAVFWLDASTLTQSAGQEVTSWADPRGEGYPVATAYTDIKPQVVEIASGELAGKKAVTFFDVGTACDMHFEANMLVKTVFFVVDIDQARNAYLLGADKNNTGDPLYWAFERKDGGMYCSTSANQLPCTYYNDGKAVASPSSTAIPTGYQLITWCATDKSAYVRNLTQDRNVAGRVGGKRLCEVIAFNRSLTDMERCEVEGYLKAKWYGTESQEGATLTMYLNKLSTKPQVRFDASRASSFHYDVEGDTTGKLVSQWDDLSGNSNNLVSNITAQTANYASVASVGGRPVLDTGDANSGIDLKLATKLNSKMVFMVGEAKGFAETKGYWLGCSDAYNFSPGKNGEIANSVHGKFSNVWQNGSKIASPTTEKPEPAGGLSVWTFEMSSGSWNQLCQDRAIATRNGGKSVAELITFPAALADEERETVEKLLMAKWKPTEEYLNDYIATAAVHVDASSASNFTYTDGKVTGWRNGGTGTDLYRQSNLFIGSSPSAAAAVENGYGAYGFTNGVPAFLMGAAGSNIDMAFTRLTNIRTVFWAMDIVRDHPSAWFLGDWYDKVGNTGTTFNFSRGRGSDSSGNYRGAYGAYMAHGEASANIRDGTMYCEGEAVNLTNDLPRTSTRIYDLVTAGNVTASSLSQDRYCANGTVNRNGGRALSELIIFTEGVYGLTRIAIRDRLANKWTRSCGWAGAGASEWGAGNYRVFAEDAEVPSAGAEASGVGFTKNATLGGGSLALGDGGLFASEGVVATIEASLTGNLGVYGPGRVVLAAGSSAVADALRIGDGATLVVASGATLTVCSGSLADDAAILVEAGGTLRVSGDEAALTGGRIELADGAVLSFNFTDSHVAPTLNAPTLALPDSGSVVVKVTADVSGLTRSRTLPLLSGVALAADDLSKFALDVGKPRFAESISIEDGSLVMTAHFRGLIICFR